MLWCTISTLIPHRTTIAKFQHKTQGENKHIETQLRLLIPQMRFNCASVAFARITDSATCVETQNTPSRNKRCPEVHFQRVERINPTSKHADESSIMDTVGYSIPDDAMSQRWRTINHPHAGAFISRAPQLRPESPSDQDTTKHHNGVRFRIQEGTSDAVCRKDAA